MTITRIALGSFVWTFLLRSISLQQYTRGQRFRLWNQNNKILEFQKENSAQEENCRVRWLISAEASQDGILSHIVIVIWSIVDAKKQNIDWSTSSWLHGGVKMYLSWLITSLLNYCFGAMMDSSLRCRSLALVPEARWNLFLNKSSSCLTALACEAAPFSTRRCGETDRDLSLLAAGINVIMRTKYKSSTETKQVETASVCLWMENHAKPALPSPALWKQQPPVLFFSSSSFLLPGKCKPLVRLLSTNSALLIAVWPSLSPIELYRDAFRAVPLTAVSHWRLLIKCLPMWFILSSTFKITSFDGSSIQELSFRRLFFFFPSPPPPCALYCGGSYHRL